MIHGIGGSGGVGVLLLAAIHSRTVALIALALFAFCTAVSMALLSTGFGYVLARPRVQRGFARVVPVFGAFGVCFGTWYMLGALAARAVLPVTAAGQVNRLRRTPSMPPPLAHLSDEALPALVARGDEAALAELYDRFGRIAYGLALRILRDATLAEDAVQDAFLAAWRTAASFDPGRGKASTWLLTLVHRRAVDVVRREERRRADPLDADPARAASRPTRPPRYARSGGGCRRRSRNCHPTSGRRSSSPTTAGSPSRSWPSGSACRSARSRAGCSSALARLRDLLGRAVAGACCRSSTTSRPGASPVVTYGLIAANLAVWLWELSSRGTRIDRLRVLSLRGQRAMRRRRRPAISPGRRGCFTSMFLHASWLHVLGNMLFLWIFGNNVEDVMGRVRFLVFYLAAGYAAALTQALVTLHYAGVGAASVPNVGASGAIAGVLGAYLVLLPHARVVTLLFGFLPLPISALFFLGFWFLFQLWQGGFSMTHPGLGRRRRVRRPRRRVRLRGARDPALPGPGAAPPALMTRARNSTRSARVFSGMRNLNEIKQEIDSLSERRIGVMRALSEGYDATLAAEHQELEEQIAQLWEEQRNARALLRFGDREVIIQKARQEERLSRAA